MTLRLAAPFLVLLAACQPAPEAAAPAAQSAPLEAGPTEAGPAPEATPATPDATTPDSAGPDATPSAETAAPARLSGRVAYPSEELPAMRVCAVDSSDPGTAVCVRTEVNQPHYSLELPAGHWWLLAWPQGTGTAGDPGLLSEASECLGSGGLGCDDHALLTIAVAAGESREGLDINDWYYEPSDFPPPMEPLDDGR